MKQEQQWRNGTTMMQSPRRRECAIIDDLLPTLRENNAYLQSLNDNWNITVPVAQATN